jgi:TRAP-type C4-dicarboxylate transport system permease large subunit
MKEIRSSAQFEELFWDCFFAGLMAIFIIAVVMVIIIARDNYKYKKDRPFKKPKKM